MTIALHSIGYDPASFLGALHEAGIMTLIDIRAVPHSRKAGFSGTRLAEHLAAAGINYLHLVALGNPPAGREAAKAGRMADYRRAMTAQLGSTAGRNGLRIIAEQAAAAPSCLMCFEAEPGQCHRNLVAARLAQLHGFEIHHIQSAERQTSLRLG